jgi:serine/threonine protein kinase
MIMEYCKCSLYDVLKAEAKPEAIADAPLHLLSIQMLKMLCGLMATGILHGDIKPQNILVGVDGQLKLSDFDLAKNTDETGRIESDPWFPLYTTWYRPPEVWRGGTYTLSADWWAMGLVLLEVYQFRRLGTHTVFTICRHEDMFGEERRKPIPFLPGFVDIARKLSTRFYTVVQQIERSSASDMSYNDWLDRAKDARQDHPVLVLANNDPISEVINGLVRLDPEERRNPESCLEKLQRVKRRRVDTT